MGERNAKRPTRTRLDASVALSRRVLCGVHVFLSTTITDHEHWLTLKELGDV